MPKYTTKSGALKAAKRIGLMGVHKMSDGKWMPGRTHSAYLKAKRKRSY